MHIKIKVMRLSWWIFGAERWFWIFNSKLIVGRNSGKLFTQVISFNIFSKESFIENTKSDTLTLPCINQLGNTGGKIFSQGISFEIWSEKSRVGNNELDALKWTTALSKYMGTTFTKTMVTTWKSLINICWCYNC